jgi:hypothetical protein
MRGRYRAKVDMLMKNDQSRDGKGPEFAGAYAEIPKKLKAYYDSLQDEAIPDKFLDLLEKLDRAEQAAQRADALKEVE